MCNVKDMCITITSIQWIKSQNPNQTSENILCMLLNKNMTVRVEEVRGMKRAID